FVLARRRPALTKQDRAVLLHDNDQPVVAHEHAAKLEDQAVPAQIVAMHVGIEVVRRRQKRMMGEVAFSVTLDVHCNRRGEEQVGPEVVKSLALEKVAMGGLVD